MHLPESTTLTRLALRAKGGHYGDDSLVSAKYGYLFDIIVSFGEEAFVSHGFIIRLWRRFPICCPFLGFLLDMVAAGRGDRD